MTEDLRKLAEDLLALGAYKTLVAEEYTRKHEELEKAYLHAGIRGQDILLPDGRKLGTVGKTDGRVSVIINDHEKMLEWLEANHPTEIVTRTVTSYDINPAYWSVLERAAKAARAGVDTDTGERLDWITVLVGEPTVRATPSSTTRDLVRQLIKERSFPLELTAE